MNLYKKIKLNFYDCVQNLSRLLDDLAYGRLLLCTQILIMTLAAFRRGWIYDELECLRSGWFVAQGMIPYVDFFQHHHPFLYYLLAPFGFFFSADQYLFWGRGISLGFCFLSLLYTYKLGLLVYDQLTAFLTVSFFLCWKMFAESGFEVRPDTPQIALATAGTYYFFLFIKQRNQKKLLISAFCYSLSFLFLQKSFMFPFFALLMLGYEWYYKQEKLSAILLWAVGYALPICLYWIFLIFQGHFWQYFVCNYLFNAEMAKSFTFARFMKMLVNEVFLPNAALWAFFFIGYSRSVTIPIRLLISILITGIISMKIDGAHYWIVALPYFSLIGIQGMRFIFDHKTGYLILFLTFLSSVSFKHWVGNVSFGNYEQRVLLKHFRSLCSESEYCFGDDLVCNLRKGPGYFWHGDFWGDQKTYGRFLNNHNQKTIDILKNMPVFVQVGKIETSDEVDSYLKKHYKQFFFPGILIRKDCADGL